MAGEFIGQPAKEIYKTALSGERFGSVIEASMATLLALIPSRLPFYKFDPDPIYCERNT